MARTGQSAYAAAFERAFDASIGKAIDGAGKVVLQGVRTFQIGFAALKTGLANPFATAAGFASLAGKATFAAQIIAALAAQRTRAAFATAAAGFAGVAGRVGRFVKRATGFGGGPRRWGRSPASAARRAARNAAKALAARKKATASFYRAARRSGAPIGIARAFATIAPRMAGAISAGTAVGPGLAAVVTAMNALKNRAERQLDEDRRILPYSGKAQQGFAGLAMGDQQRDLRMARADEETTLTLARTVNMLREGQSGIERLQMGLGNRFGIAAGAAVGPAFREIGNLADQFNNWMNKNDPKGDALAGWFDRRHEDAAGIMGAIIHAAPALLGGGGAGWAGLGVGWDAAADQVKREREAAAAKMLEGDAWSQFISRAMNQPAIKPARPLRP